MSATVAAAATSASGTPSAAVVASQNPFDGLDRIVKGIHLWHAQHAKYTSCLVSHTAPAPTLKELEKELTVLTREIGRGATSGSTALDRTNRLFLLLQKTLHKASQDLGEMRSQLSVKLTGSNLSQEKAWEQFHALKKAAEEISGRMVGPQKVDKLVELQTQMTLLFAPTDLLTPDLMDAVFLQLDKIECSIQREIEKNWFDFSQTLIGFQVDPKGKSLETQRQMLKQHLDALPLSIRQRIAMKLHEVLKKPAGEPPLDLANEMCSNLSCAEQVLFACGCPVPGFKEFDKVLQNKTMLPQIKTAMLGKFLTCWLTPEEARQAQESLTKDLGKLALPATSSAATPRPTPYKYLATQSARDLFLSVQTCFEKCMHARSLYLDDEGKPLHDLERMRRRLTALEEECAAIDGRAVVVLSTIGDTLGGLLKAKIAILKYEFSTLHLRAIIAFDQQSEGLKKRRKPNDLVVSIANPVSFNLRNLRRILDDAKGITPPIERTTELARMIMDLERDIASAETSLQAKAAEARNNEIAAIVRLLSDLYEVFVESKDDLRIAFVLKYKALPSDLRRKIELKIWELAGKPEQTNYGAEHVLEDFLRLRQAIVAVAHEIGAAEEQLDILSRSLLKFGRAEPDLATEARKFQMEYLPLILEDLPQTVRNTIYGRIWEASDKTSKDPKFGENNASKNMVLLLEVIQNPTKKAPSAPAATPVAVTNVAVLSAAIPNPFAKAITAIEVFQKETLPTLRDLNVDAIEINAQFIALIEGKMEDTTAHPLLSRAVLNQLCGALYHAIKPTTNDPNWGMNNLVHHIDKVLLILASTDFIAKAAPK